MPKSPKSGGALSSTCSCTFVSAGEPVKVSSDAPRVCPAAAAPSCDTVVSKESSCSSDSCVPLFVRAGERAGGRACILVMKPVSGHKTVCKWRSQQDAYSIPLCMHSTQNALQHLMYSSELYRVHPVAHLMCSCLIASELYRVHPVELNRVHPVAQSVPAAHHQQ